MANTDKEQISGGEYSIWCPLECQKSLNKIMRYLNFHKLSRNEIMI